jgi:glycosyltransferase involved in cell wall biosynthesis
MRIIRNIRLKQFDHFAASIPFLFDKGGRTIYRQRNEIKVFDVDGTLLNVKRYRTPHFPNRIAYTFFRPSKAERAFRYALRLRAEEIETPEPVACILTKKNGLIHYTYYISKQVPYERTMYEFGTGGIAGREHILKAFARYTAKLHQSGVYHKDYSPGNILFRETDGEVRFCLVDINRMQFGNVSVQKGCANFARLWGQEPMFRLLAREYARARQADENDCVRRILHGRDKFWNSFTRKRPLPFPPDGTDENTGAQLSVILSTCNQPAWLEKVLWGYEAQTMHCFEMIIADDGSTIETTNLIERIKPQLSYPVKHVWHEKNGFRKCRILNRGILAASTGYLLFSDGDCIPRRDFIATHLKYRRKGRFLSGGYCKLPAELSRMITKEDILENRCFDLQWLKKRGLPSAFRNRKLTSAGIKEWLLNHLTPTRPTWNGHNASGWLPDILAANGFDERMQYGGEDRELGERLENSHVRGKQIRYSAICIHLEHSRGYKTPEAIRRNEAIRKITRRQRLRKTDYGLPNRE